MTVLEEAPGQGGLTSGGLYLKNAWYQAAWSHEIGAKGTLARTILDTPVLLFRDDHGAVSAILDRCPHRFAPLSRGRFDGATLTCGYHGLGFDRTGRCVRNPHGPIPPRAKVQAFPVAEKHAGVWIWLGDMEKADPAGIPDVGFIDRTPETARARGYMMTPANWQLIMDNLLDLAHSDYLHPAFGNFMTQAEMKLDERADGMTLRWGVKDSEVPVVFKSLVPEGHADMWVQADWRPTGVIGIEAGATPPGAPPSDVLYSYHSLTPETPTSTHYFYLFARNFRTDDTEFTARLQELGAHAFQAEDKPMIAAQQARIGTADITALKPVFLSVDVGAAKARRRLQILMETMG